MILCSIGWVLDKVLDGADWLARKAGHLQHEGLSDHFHHDPLTTGDDDQLSLW